ncbi:MAG: DUF3576 domain-containing protein [Proteobacteria bacterium]|nr:DUF3576 domain-containing protein [Pseudomonadota bacterium]
MKYTRSISFIALTLLAVSMSVTGCSSWFKGAKTENSYPVDPDDVRRARYGKLSGDGVQLLGGDDDAGSSKGATLGVNSFLWRATLDTLSFAPLASVDPRGGVIITDWYESPEAPGERFKMNVLILDTKLRADAVRASVFRQVKNGTGWKDAKVDPKVGRDIEDKILTRARQLKVASAR